MGYDAIANSRISAFAKDSARTKKGNRLAKLKQDKVDVRREQWLSQVKNKGNKMGTNGSVIAIPLIPKCTEGLKTQENTPRRARRDKDKIPGTFDGDAISWITSRVCGNLVHISSGKDSSGSSSCSSGSCSSSCSEGERDEGCLDDWEAMADALTADSNKQTSDVKQRSELKQFATHDTDIKSCDKTYQAAILNKEALGRAHWSQKNSRAWSPDDIFRPESLPTLSRQTSHHCLSRGPTTILAWKKVASEQRPLSCPICCEDLDGTDSSFLPCPCGFQLCLFCHKRILEVDARCPGCRKQYGSLNSGVAFGGKPVNSSL